MRKWSALISVGVILLVILGGIRVCLGLGIPHRVGAVNKLLELFHRERQALSVSLETEDLTASGSLFWCPVAGERCYGIETEGITLYYQEEALYLDNGRGYDLSGLIPEELDDLEELLWLLLLADYQTEVTETGIVHQFTATERLNQLAERFIPEAARYTRMLTGSTLIITERQGEVQEVRIADPSGNTVIATISEQQPESIPTDLLMIMKAEKTIPVDRIIPLLKACITLGEKETIGADASLVLECGPLPIQDTAQLFCAQDAIWFVRDDYTYQLKLGTLDTKRHLLIGLCFELCRNGALNIPKDGTASYTLQLESNQVEAIFEQVLPEVSGLSFRFEDSKCQINVSDNQIDGMLLTCTGKMPFLITEIPISFSMDLTMMKGSISLPNTVSP